MSVSAAPCDIVIAGGGLAGLRCAQALRRNGYDGRLTIVEEEVGAPYDRPPLSKGVLTGRLQPGEISLCTSEELDVLDIVRYGGSPLAALERQNRRVRLADGTAIAYDRLVIATGASPRTIGSARGKPGVHVVRTMADSVALRDALRPGARICVIGGGVLGCEVAASAHDVGCDVTIVEALPTLMARAVGSGAVAESVLRLHQDAAVDVVRGTKVVEIAGADRVTGVRTDDGRLRPADVVVVALGVEPAVGWLDGSGLEISDGVVCNEHLAADGRIVFAAGDVARWREPGGSLVRLEHWTSAVEHAETVAHNAVNPQDRWVRHVHLPYVWSDQYGVKIQTIGWPGRADAEHVLAADLARNRLLVLFGAEGRVCGAAAVGMAGRLMRLRPLVTAAGEFGTACRDHAA